MHPPFSAGSGGGGGGEGGVLSLQPNFQKGEGLTRPHHLEKSCWERGADFLSGGLQFSHK